MTSTANAPFPLARATALARHAAACCALLGLAGVAVAQENKDTIQLKDGKSETGLVKSEDFSGLSWTPSKGSSRTIEWKEIKPDGIVYGTSADFAAAKENLDQGKLEDALTKFEELLGDAKLRPVLKQNAMYYAATIHQRKSEWDKAIEGYKAVVKENPKSRWLMDVGEALVACYVAKKDVAGADKALNDLQSAAITAGIEGSFTSAVNVLKGRLYEEQGKLAEALAAYGVAEKGAGVSPMIVQEARLGLGRCLAATNKRTEAEAAFRKLVNEDAPNTVLAGAWNGIGDILREDAYKAKDADKLLDALYCYLRGVVQYAPLPGDATREYRRSIQGSADCFKYISDLEKNPDRKRAYATRAQERIEQLKKEFPSQ